MSVAERLSAAAPRGFVIANVAAGGLIVALVWILVVVWPGVAAIRGGLSAAGGDEPGAAGSGSAPAPAGAAVIEAIDLRLLFATLMWGVAIAGGATVVGAVAAAGVASAARAGGGGASDAGEVGRRRVAGALRAMMIAALCLPSYLSFWTWGLVRLPGSPLASWARGSSERVNLLIAGQLWWALVAWSWPIVALAFGGALARVPRERLEQARLDGAGRAQRAIMLLREARSGLVLGFALVFLTTLTSYVPFDLAPVDTYTNALRRVRYEFGASAALAASAPMVVVAFIAALGLFAALRDPPETDAGDDDYETGGASDSPIHDRRGRVRLAARRGFRSLRGGAMLAVVPLAITLGVPVALLAYRLGGIEPFMRLGPIDGASLARSVVMAMISGAALGGLAVLSAWLWSSRWRLARLFMTLVAVSFLWIAFTPAATIGAMLVNAYNRPGILMSIYTSPVMILFGHIARFGWLATLAGRWVAMNEARTTGDLRRIDGAESIFDWTRAQGWRLIGPALATAGIGLTLSLGEISTTVIVTPPSYQMLAERLLNKMHYAREDSVIAISLIVIALSLAIGAACALALRPLGAHRAPRRGASWPAGLISPGSAPTLPLLMLLLTLLPLLPAGCDIDGGGEARRKNALETETIFGSTGRAPGQFIYPRAIACDASRERAYIVDKSGRVQVFSVPSGEVVGYWTLPKFDMGLPTGVSVHPIDGRVFIANTHEHCVTIYSPDGELLFSFGEYGEGPGQFIYPTDVAFGPDETLYVSEYGGNDRIQVFTADGEFIREFGAFGYGKGEFSRPQSMVYDVQHEELWIADSCNHRLVVTDRNGKWLRTIGGPGSAPGEFNYPYGLLRQPDGGFIVAEFGGNRVQHLSRDGASLGVFGVAGVGPGELRSPWGVAATERWLVVLDSGNDRVQVVRRPG